MSKITENLIGKKFGNWTVLKDLGTRFMGEYFCKTYSKIRRTYHRFYLCRCKCGKEKEVQANHLKSGRSTQCISCARKGNKNSLIHGMYYTVEYRAWINIIQRCTNPNSQAYKNYGARGITVCPRWLNSFENFYKDMGKRPKGMSIDRINNDGNYEPLNCRWATDKKQAINRRTIKLNENNIRRIRELHKRGFYTNKDLAGYYGVSEATISNILNNKSWAHI